MGDQIKKSCQIWQDFLITKQLYNLFMTKKSKPATPPPEMTYSAKVLKLAVSDNDHLIVTLDIAVPSPETMVGMYDAKKAGIILDCRNALPANSLTNLDADKNETDNQKAKNGTDGVGRGRFIKQRD